MKTRPSPSTTLGLVVVLTAIIWAVVILAVSLALDGSPQATRVMTILGGGAAATIILLGGLNTQLRKRE